MRIDNPGLTTGLVKEEVKQDKKTAILPPPQHTTADVVTITDTATRMQQLEQVITAQSAVNNQRVEELQHVINSGGPKISHFDLAAKILNFENNLNNARTGT